MNFLSSMLLFFLIMDPFGNISSFLFQLRNQTQQEAFKTVLREMLLALGIALAVYAIGDRLRCTLDLSEPAVHMATGMVLFLAAITILFPGSRGIRQGLPDDPKPFLVPLAMPLIAGPCLLATVLLYAQGSIPASHTLPALLTAWILATAILLSANFWQRLLGRNGLTAIERLLAMILVMLAIQRFLSGVQLFATMLRAGADLG